MGKPGPGFFNLVWDLGRQFDAGDPFGEFNYWEMELDRVFECWEPDGWACSVVRAYLFTPCDSCVVCNRTAAE